MLSVVDLGLVQLRIARAEASEIDSDTDRTRRAEFLGTWAAMGIITMIVIPLIRLVLLLWGIHALTVASGGAMMIDLSKPRSDAASYGGCAPAMAIFMFYYFVVVSVLLLIIAAACVILGSFFGIRTCCPARRSTRAPLDSERVALKSAGESSADAEGGESAKAAADKTA